MGCDRIIAYVDKTVVKITGLQIDRINLTEIEKKIISILNRPVRVIGVSGEGLEFDVYEFPPEQVFRNEHNIIEAIANEGIKGTEVAKIVKAEHVPEIEFEELILDSGEEFGCPSERWLKRKTKINKNHE
ncbi:hypothetical protein SCACP_29800 [Sporomusa carbonis]|uniref:hypothetical protein n=1 Tax=Sporomusa carbonis TaxID=3076075 RepID=UPI003A60DED9